MNTRGVPVHTALSPPPPLPPTTAAITDDAAGRSSYGEAAALSLAGVAASISLLQRQCEAGWRWPGDLWRLLADEILATMRSDLGPMGLARDPLRLRLVSTTAREDPPWVIFATRGRPGLLARAWWWWLPSPPKAVGQAGSDGSWIPLLAPAASWGDIVAGENEPTPVMVGDGDVYVYTLMKASSSSYRQPARAAPGEILRSSDRTMAALWCRVPSWGIVCGAAPNGKGVRWH